MGNALKFFEELNGPTTVGMLVRAYRTRNDLTLEAVADILGVTKSYVSDLEHDRKTISLRQAREIAEKLGDSVDVYAKVWLENRLSEAGLTGLIEVRPIAATKIKGSSFRVGVEPRSPIDKAPSMLKRAVSKLQHPVRLSKATRKTAKKKA